MKSERLVYRPICNKDVKSLHKIFGNEKLTRYFESGPDKDMNETRRRINKILKHWELYDLKDSVQLSVTYPSYGGYAKFTNIFSHIGGLIVCGYFFAKKLFMNKSK